MTAFPSNLVLSQISYNKLSSIPEESDSILSFDQPCKTVQDEECRDLALKVSKKWSELVLQRSTNFHDIFKSEGISELVLHYTGEYHKCCKIAARKSFVFCPPPFGKPNPQQSLDPNFIVPRKRVTQKAQKGETCWYYAMSLIAQRIGKNPLPNQKEERKYELSVSSRRKAHTALDDLFWLQSFAQKLATNHGVKWVTKTMARNLLNKNLGPCELRDTKVKWGPFLEAFCQQKKYENLITYVVTLTNQACYEIDLKFLQESRVGITLQEYYEHQLQPLLDKSWSQLTVFEMKKYTQVLATHFSFIVRGLNLSYWHPSQEIDALIQELWLHGPHLIQADLGKSFYSDGPTLLRERVQNMKVYAWPAGARRLEKLASHSVVIVGANKTFKRVYYLDPQDEFDPNQLNLVKIYATSYEKLKVNIRNLQGVKFEGPTPVFTKMLLNFPNGYAMHGNPRTNYY